MKKFLWKNRHFARTHPGRSVTHTQLVYTAIVVGWVPLIFVKGSQPNHGSKVQKSHLWRVCEFPTKREFSVHSVPYIQNHKHRDTPSWLLTALLAVERKSTNITCCCHKEQCTSCVWVTDRPGCVRKEFLHKIVQNRALAKKYGLMPPKWDGMPKIHPVRSLSTIVGYLFMVLDLSKKIPIPLN